MKKYVIIGNSAAGISAVEAIRKRDKVSLITVITDEEYPVYCRCLISYFIAGETDKAKIFYRAKDFYQKNNIELLLNKKVIKVDPKKQVLVFEDKTQVGYDSLLIATGSRAKLPETKGIKKKEVFALRTLKDALQINGLLNLSRSVCVLGGGLVGLKAATALRKRNVEVKVVIKSKQILSQMLDVQAAEIVQERLLANGIELLLGQDVVEIIGDPEVRAVKLDNGKAFAASFVVVGKGVEPNKEIIAHTDMKVANGILVDNHMQSSFPNIYAAGDVAEAYDITLGKPAINAIWPVAVEEGRIAGANMTGDPLSYEGSLGMNSLDFFGLPLVSLGVYNAKDIEGQNVEEIYLSKRKDNIYKKLIFKDEFLVGAVLVGDIRESGVFSRIIRERLPCRVMEERMLEDNFGYPDIIEFVQEKERFYV